ncbi:hypothetical protein CYMTET_17773 [Cymbomonas tetramitiformis]|uniref:Uncharacterized protein n=1 Tax=Cymbomonas tetramitiformis TaxID=36881 RepID=A0AAE0KY05_9CHLO|nr:hypothetical protein CYMTET_26356 [Cymbomonas tetramitiformis]KAK3274019.1 hypothetical protein CYMTET_17773 [Cymbomonas tetramitiformis]
MRTQTRERQSRAELTTSSCFSLSCRPAFAPRRPPRHRSFNVASSASDEVPATLTEETVWRLVLSLSEPAKTDDEADISGPSINVVMKLKFLEDQGYEPPQGTVEVVEDELGLISEEGFNFWKLAEEEGEDPLDKGGLWIWGLFSEPLYPLMNIQLDVNEVPISDGTTFPAGKLFMKVPHARGSKTGVALSGGTLSVRQIVAYQADLIGLSKANIAEVRPCGTVRFTSTAA